MRGDLGDFREKATVAHHSQSVDLLMMPFDKPHMSKKSIKIRPARKGSCVDHQPWQFSMFRDVRIDLVGQGLEVGGLERSVGIENEYSFWQKQLVVEHGSSSPTK
jgi:hypothetical protein